MPRKSSSSRGIDLDIERKRRAREADRQRGSRSARGYGRDWQRLRAVVLAEEPLCRFCKDAGLTVLAQVVDHVVPISEAPDLRLDRANLRSLCKSCHDRRTALDQGFAKGKAKPVIGPDGLPVNRPGHPWFTPPTK